MKYILLLVFISISTFCVAQDEFPALCPKIENKKALKLFNKAQDIYSKTSDNAAARELLDKAIEEEPQFAEAYLFLATLARRKKEFHAMEQAYLKAVEICPNYDPDAYYHLGTYYYDNAGSDAAKYEAASKYLGTYLKFEKTPDKKHKEVEQLFEDSKAFTRLFKNKVPFNPVPVEGISTAADEYLPCISADNELAFFTRRVEVMGSKSAWAEAEPKKIERFSFSILGNDGKFNVGEPLPPPFNTTDNQGGASLSIDNRMMYFTTCKINKKGNMNCDIFSSENINGNWTNIKNLGPVVNGEDTWESQPSIASDGVTLYFSSIRPGNIGFSNENPTCDIYKTTLQPNGEWSTPVNLGSPINTSGNEKSPFMHGDSKTLYFASSGHLGVGGYDVYYTKEKDDGKFEKPRNIGYPINSEFDDLSFIVSTDGKTAYFASDKYKGKGGYDIYSFELYKEARPEKVLFLKGTVKDENGEPVKAEIQLKNLKTNSTLKVKVDSTTGRYASIVRFDSDYVVTVKKENAAFNSTYISQKDTAVKTITKLDMDVKEVKVGGAYTINNINYNTNSAELLEESKRVLDEFAEYLKENPRMKIVIKGHTDNVGNEKDNLSLSHDRAFTVFEYLTNKGIDKQRLSFEGLGKSQPIASNETEEGRAKNRRTEFVIVSK